MPGKTYISLYIALTAILLLSLNAYVASNPMFYRKIGKIDRNYQTLREAESAATDKDLLLVIGNSYVEASFRPGGLDPAGPVKISNTVLFTVFGMPLVDMLGIVEHLPADSRVDTVLVGLGYNYANPVGGTSSAYANHFATNPVQSAWSSVPLVRGRSIASTMLREDVKCALARYGITRCTRDEQSGTLTDASADPTPTPLSAATASERMRKSVARRYAEYRPFTSGIAADLPLYLQRLSEACEQRGIRLIAYTAPVFGALRDRLGAEFLARFRASVVDAGITYVDLNEVYPDWDAAYFSDATHVSKGGPGTETTRYLHALVSPP